MKRKNRVLNDHKKQGKKFIPPLLQFNYIETSYEDRVIPEIIWNAIFNDFYGKGEGAELGLRITQLCKTLFSDIECVFVYLSSFSQLSEAQKEELKLELKKSNLLEKVISPLIGFNRIYPENPIHFLFDDKEDYKERDIMEHKNLLYQLYDKTSVKSTFALGNVIYYHFVLGKLTVHSNSPMAELPKLKDYPNTLISKMIASGIRSSINLLAKEPSLVIDENWNNYFWNRGLQIEPCDI